MACRRRLYANMEKDASVNGLTFLDILAQVLTLELDESLGALRPLFETSSSNGNGSHDAADSTTDGETAA